MKQICSILLILCVIFSLAACNRKLPDPTLPATNPTQAPTLPAPTEPTLPPPTDPPAPARQMIPAGKDQILAAPTGVPFDDAAHIETINQYQKEYKNIVLSAADTNPFVTFIVDYDIASCSMVRVYDVTEKGAEYEITRSYYYLCYAEVEGNKIIVPVDFWLKGGFLVQRLDMIAYLIYVRDTNGVSHPYYFRVDYSAFEKLQGGAPSVVGIKKDGLILDIYGVGYVYVKTALELAPATQLLIEYYASDLKQETGTFTDADGTEQKYAYVLNRTVTLYSNASSAPGE